MYVHTYTCCNKMLPHLHPSKHTSSLNCILAVSASWQSSLILAACRSAMLTFLVTSSLFCFSWSRNSLFSFTASLLSRISLRVAARSCAVGGTRQRQAQFNCMHTHYGGSCCVTVQMPHNECVCTHIRTYLHMCSPLRMCQTRDYSAVGVVSCTVAWLLWMTVA